MPFIFRAPEAPLRFWANNAIQGKKGFQPTGKEGLATAASRVSKQEGRGNAAGVKTEADFFRAARSLGMPVDNRGLKRDEPGVHVTKKGRDTAVAYYDETGKPAGFVQMSGNKIDIVAIRPSMRGQGHGTKMYDQIQDKTDINLYRAVGSARDFTVAGRAFAEKWLVHRMAIEGG